VLKNYRLAADNDTDMAKSASNVASSCTRGLKVAGTVVAALAMNACGPSDATSQRGDYSSADVQRVFAKHHEPLIREPGFLVLDGIDDQTEEIAQFRATSTGIRYGPNMGSLMQVVVYKHAATAQRAVAPARKNTSGGVVVEAAHNLLVIAAPASDGRAPASVRAALADLAAHA
jgi:hypothetical protein